MIESTEAVWVPHDTILSGGNKLNPLVNKLMTAILFSHFLAAYPIYLPCRSDRCCARLGNCDKSQSVPSEGVLFLTKDQGQLNGIVYYDISGTPVCMPEGFYTWTSTAVRLTYTGGDISQTREPDWSVTCWQCAFAPLFAGGRNTGRPFGPICVA